jgi:hypothetical protein
MPGRFCLLGAALVAAACGRASAAIASPSTASISCLPATSVMRSWLAAWQAQNFRRMADLSEVSWRQRARGPVGELRDQYGFKDVVSYRFVRCSGNSVSARVTFTVTYKTFKRVRVEITGMVLREDRDGAPSPVGRWGVNPISTLREDPA